MKKKISVSTRNYESSYKLKFREEKEVKYLEVHPSALPHKGTKIKVVSLFLLASSDKKIIEKVQVLLQFVQKPPLL